MTIHRAPWIECDAEGCPVEFFGRLDALFRELQAAAQDAGWKVERFNPKADLCPEHNGARL